jgi:predicted nucleotidyltransferase
MQGFPQETGERSGDMPALIRGRTSPRQFAPDIQKAAEILRSFGAKEVYIFGSLADAERDHHPRDIDIGVSGLLNEVFFRTYGELLGVMDHRFGLVDLDFDSPFVRKLREHGNLERVG